MQLPLQLPAGCAAGLSPIVSTRQRMQRQCNGESCHSNHLLHLIPLRSWLQLQLSTVEPVHIPIFQPMQLTVFVNISTQLVAGPAPRELPAPVSFWLIIPGMWFNVIKAQGLKLVISYVFLTALPPVFY